MPLTPFQREVARLLIANRTPESYLAGGAVLNRRETDLRFSNDLDIFHDIAASVAVSAEADAKVLQSAGYSVEWTIRNDGFFRAEVGRASDRVRLDWTTDSTFRFFPVQQDEEFGYCLHPADIATNKILTLAGRSEIRDFLDILQLDQQYLGLGAMTWAACGKDPGFTPDLLLDQMNRHSRYQDIDLTAENLARPVDLKELKRHWLAAKEAAEHLFAQLPPEDLGCLYLDRDNQPVTPDPGSANFANLTRHKGSVGGAWAKIS
jgi:hypothetical protein